MQTRTSGLGFIESNPVPSGTLAQEDGCSFCRREPSVGVRIIVYSRNGYQTHSLAACEPCRLDLIHHLSARD